MCGIRFRESERTYTYDEIGDILGMSPSTVKAIERRALLRLLRLHGKELKELLEGYSELAC